MLKTFVQPKKSVDFNIFRTTIEISRFTIRFVSNKKESQRQAISTTQIQFIRHALRIIRVAFFFYLYIHIERQYRVISDGTNDIWNFRPDYALLN